MSKKQKTYPAEFKTKIVLELLAGDQTDRTRFKRTVYRILKMRL